MDFENTYRASISGVDFEEVINRSIVADDGIYLEYDKIRGYMFIQEAYITYNGGPAIPNDDLRVQQFNIYSGRFKQRYEWSNPDITRLTSKLGSNITMSNLKFALQPTTSAGTLQDLYFSIT